MARASSLQRPEGLCFPSWFVWPLFILTSAIRVYYVIQPRNWWLVHPDEIYQTMEVAHSEVYGYGFGTYEFRRPVAVSKTTPDIHRQEMDHGMFALRSFLLPRAYVTVTWALGALGLEFTPFLTWKVAHTLIASTLLLAVYRYVIVVFRSRDTACLAAILCAACAQLHVLGTHTLVNSLLAPPVFLSLAQLHALLDPDDGDEEEEENHGEVKKRAVSKLANGSSPPKPSTENLPNPTSKKKTTKHKPHRKEAPNKPVSRENGTHGNGGFTTRYTANGDADPSRGELQSSSNNGLNNGRHRSSSAGHSNGHSIPNGTACQHDGAPDLLFKPGYLYVLKSLLQNFAAGFVLGVCVYVRIDVTALALASLLPHWSPFRTRYGDVMVSACGAVCGVAMGVLDDFRCYGWGVMTPYNWFRFNVEKDYSSLLFGSDAFHKYIMDIFFQNVGTTVLTIVTSLCCISKAFNSPQLQSSGRTTSLYGRKDTPSSPQPSEGKNRVLRTSLSWLLLLSLYSFKGHKELRFVHNVIVLVLVTCAALVQSSLRKLVTSRPLRRGVAVVGVALFALSQWQDVASLTDGSWNKLASKEAGDTQDVNQCLHHISSRDDLTGLFIDRNLYDTGGYALLHRNVPIFSFLGKNFYEYRVEDRLTVPAKTGFSGPLGNNVSVAYMGRFSNYVSRQRSLYVLQYVLQDPRYNYLLMRTLRDYTLVFGDAVFTCGTFQVYRRPKKPTAEQAQRMQQAMHLPPPTNATVLLHEADMLFFHGAWARAVERFRLVLRVDPARAGAYLPLAASYSRLGDRGRSMEVARECYEKFGRAVCEARRPPVLVASGDHG